MESVKTVYSMKLDLEKLPPLWRQCFTVWYCLVWNLLSRPDWPHSKAYVFTS